MLPAEHRMRNSAEFRDTIGAGRRAGRRTVVVHIRPADPADPGAAGPSRVGFVVSKKVGNAVVRNRVRRRLRHLMRPLISSGPAPASVVVRALPAAASQPARLADDLADAYRRAAGVL